MTKNTYLFLLFCFSAVFMFANNIYVDITANPDGDGSIINPFDRIVDAIDELAFCSGEVNIYVAAGDYEEQLDINLSTYLVTHLNLYGAGMDQSYISNQLVNSMYLGNTITITGTENQNVMINGFTIRNSGLTCNTVMLLYDAGIRIHDINGCRVSNTRFSNCISSLQIRFANIENLSINNCEFNMVDGIYRNGICIINNAYELLETLIYNNYFNICDNGDSSFAIRILQNGSIVQETSIENNTFLYQSALQNCNISIEDCAMGEQALIIDSNQFEQIQSIRIFDCKGKVTNNYLKNSSADALAIMYCGTDDDFLVENNLFYNSNTAISIVDNPASNVVCKNNTYVDCNNVLFFDSNFHNVLFINNISIGGGIFVSYNDSITNSWTVTYQYNCRDAGVTYNNNLIDCGGNIFVAQPKVYYDPLTDEYSIWRSDWGPSPCMDSGYPGENHELTDPDGTVPDMGFAYFPHVHKVYPFFHTPQPPYIFWTSFPVVDDRTYVDNHHWNELGFMFESHIDPDSTQLQSIEWSYDQGDGKMEWDDDNEEWEQTTHQVHPQIGYKITFANTPIDDVIVNGFKSDPETTSVAWSDNLAQGNWVGYFVPKTQCAFLSLSKVIPETADKTYLDYVHKIKTQSWATGRVDPDPRSPWIIGPERYTFSEGDMVVLALLPDAPNEMFWNITETTREPYTRDEVQFFSYQEKLDYTPMFIEFDPEDVPTEVGIYVNGECKGAAVVDYNLLEVNLYIEDAKAADIEIICHYEGKGKKKMANWTVYNPESGFFEIIPIAEVNTNDYIYISFAKEPGSSIMPMLTTLDQNYPNPFNPDTRISFTLAEPMAVCLEVFNLKGQKVKTLANGDFAKGRHAITWNARDERDQKVASGIYFYRLSTPQGKITAKMMLMK